MIIMCYLGVTGQNLSLNKFIMQCKNNHIMKDIDYYLEPDESESPREFANFVDSLQHTVKDCNIYINYNRSILDELIELRNKPFVIIPKSTDVMRYLDIYKSYKPGLDISMRKKFFTDLTHISSNHKIYVYSLPQGVTIKDKLNDIYKCIGEIKDENSSRK